jgi:ribonuclease Z
MLNRIAGVALAACVALAGQAFAFEGIRLTLLGAGSASQAAMRTGSAILIEAGDEVLLVDCRPGTVQRLEQTGVGLSELTAVFITSLDPALMDGCRELWSAERTAGRQPPAVWGPQGTRAVFDEVDRERNRDEPASDAHDLVDNVVYQSDGVTVTAFVTDNPALPQTFGYRVDAYRRSAIVSGTTRYSENLIRNARGVHVLVHEVAAASAQSLNTEAIRSTLELHTSPEEAGRVFKAVRPYLAVYAPVALFGLSEDDLLRRTRRSYSGPLEIGRDSMVIEIQNEVQLRSAPSDGPRAGR